jgi:hypothetical protein
MKKNNKRLQYLNDFIHFLLGGGGEIVFITVVS